MPTSAGSLRSSSRMPEEAVRGNSLKVAFQELREMIVHGKLSPGTWIIEAELAERLGLSRTPVRGALQWLQREGYVSSIVGTSSKSRMIVTPLTKEDARELYSIVGHIEGLAARLTAQLPQPARTKLLKRLRELNAGLSELARSRRPDANRIFDLDMTLHRTIVEASAGPRLLEIHRSVQPQTERYWRLYASAIIDELKTSVDEHNVILSAIAKGDSSAAEKGIQMNWDNGAHRLAKVIETLGERGSW